MLALVLFFVYFRLMIKHFFQEKEFMKNKISLLPLITLISLFAIFYSQAKIVEHQQIDTVFTYLAEPDYNKQTLVIFDVDNTLVEPSGWVGGTPWFEHLVHQKIAQGLDRTAAFIETLDICCKVQYQLTLVPAEKNTAPTVQQAIQKNMTVIALTARPACMANHTIEQLCSHGIDFGLSGFQNINTKDEVYHYQQGIIFCASGAARTSFSKGAALTSILKKLNYRPKKIVYIDDALKYLNSVEEALKAFDPNIEFIGIRYGHLDYKFKLFDATAAEKELNSHFEKLKTEEKI